ncbi:glycosyltransferase family 4 protein [Patescibacteria group bacterium]|nr:glycosyltransferase family 4 protein [Patescibacteria group bacterium]
MKILMLTPYLPYPDSSGGQIRTLNLLKHLYKNHQITLVSLIKNKSENKYKKHLLKYCHKILTFQRSPNPFTLKNIIRTGFTSQPFLIVRNSAPGVKAAVKKELDTGNYDIIHAETFYVMPSIPETTTPIVLVDQTIEYLVYQHYINNTASIFIRPLFNIDLAKLKYWEKYYWQKADQVVAVSHQDSQEMKKLLPDLDVKIVPNGVNLNLFKKKTSWTSKNPVILFVSNFKWLQNKEAAHLLIEQVFPLVQKEIPNVKLHIIGQHIPKNIIDLSSHSINIENLPEDDTNSLVKAWNQDTVFASTIRGPGGTRLKNLAAMASQQPIVSTKVGIQGLGAKHGVHVLIGNTPLTLSKHIVKLIKSPQLAEKLAKNARAHVEKNYNYKNIATKLSSIYHQLNKK